MRRGFLYVLLSLCILFGCGAEKSAYDLDSSKKETDIFFEDVTQYELELDLLMDEDSSPPPECLKHEECPEEKFCNEGICEDDICMPGDTYCFSDFEMNICDSFGSGYVVFQCAGNQKCAYGECRDIICAYPWKGCYDGMIAECDETGTKYKLTPCPKGQVCDNSGECQMNYGYIYVILDNYPYDETKPVATSYNAYKEYTNDILSEGDIDQCLKDMLNDPKYVSVAPAENFPDCQDPSLLRNFQELPLRMQ